MTKKTKRPTIQELFTALSPYFGKYQVTLHIWGNGNNHVHIAKDYVHLYSSIKHKNVTLAIEEALNYLNRINKKK